MLVFVAQSVHHCHTAQFVIRSLQSEGAWAQLLNPGHGLLDSSTKGWQELFRPLSDGEELVISHKASAGCLLHIECLERLVELANCALIVLSHIVAHCCYVSLLLCRPIDPASPMSVPFIGFKACLHETNWSSQPPGSILPRQPPLLNSAWWATEAALQPPF